MPEVRRLSFVRTHTLSLTCVGVWVCVRLAGPGRGWPGVGVWGMGVGVGS